MDIQHYAQDDSGQGYYTENGVEYPYDGQEYEEYYEEDNENTDEQYEYADGYYRAVGESGEDVGDVASGYEESNSNSMSESVDVSSIGSLPEEIAETDTHRTKLVKEVISSERNYLNHLNTVIQIYLEPMRSNRPAVLEVEYVTSIFSCIEKIKELSEDVLADLVELLESGSENVGKPFLSKRARYQDYITYGKGHGDSIEMISKLNEKKPSFVAFLQQVRDTDSKKLDLPAYLIMPVQRMPRIKLLLQDILGQTDKEHADYSDIKDALDMISSTTKILNEEIRKQENKLKVQKIQNELVGGPRIITDSRVFVREGSMMKVCRKVPKARWFFLFSDILIYTSVSTTPPSSATAGPYVNPKDVPTSYTFHRMMNLMDIKIKDLKDKENQKNAFQIISSTEKSFTVYSETPKEKNNWFEDFKLLSIKLIDENQTHNIHDLESTEVPVWVPDKEANKCMFCNDSFTVINRRHHCRNCGKVVCGSCSPGKKLLPHVKKHKPVRVCLFCYDFISMNEKKDESSSNLATLKQGSSSPQLQRTNTFQKLLDYNGKKKANESSRNSGEHPHPDPTRSASSHSIGGTLRRLKHLAIKPSDQVKTMKEQNRQERVIDDEKNLNRAQSEPFLITKSKIALPIVGGPPRIISSSGDNGRRSNTISTKNNNVQLTPTPPAPVSSSSAPSLIQVRKSKNDVVLTPTPPAPTTMPAYQHQPAASTSQEQLQNAVGENPLAPRRTERTFSQPPPPTQAQLKAVIENQKNVLSSSTGKSVMKPPPRKNTPPKPVAPDLTNIAPSVPPSSAPPAPPAPPVVQRKVTDPGPAPPFGARKLPILTKPPSSSDFIKQSNPQANPKKNSNSEIIGTGTGRPLPPLTSSDPLPSSDPKKSSGDILKPMPPLVAKRVPLPVSGETPEVINSNEQTAPTVSPRKNTLTKPIVPIATAASAPNNNDSNQQESNAPPPIMPRRLSNGPLPIRKPNTPLPIPTPLATAQQQTLTPAPVLAPAPIVNPINTTTPAPPAPPVPKVMPTRGRPLPTPPA